MLTPYFLKFLLIISNGVVNCFIREIILPALMTSTPDLEFETFEFNIEKPCDVVISGLGFIAVKNAPAKVSVTVIKGCGVMVRDAIIG